MEAYYPRAPITEAVIAFEFADSIRKESVLKAVDRLKKHYVFADEETVTKITVDAQTGKTNVEQTWAGVRLSSGDRAEVALCRPSFFVCSRLAPYPTWEKFRDRAQQEWQIWKGAVGLHQIKRIGLRYVNRIDIPAAEGGLKIEDYLNFAARLPEGPDVPISAYAMQVVRPLEEDSLQVILNSATVPSPLVGYASLSLDIDVFREKDVPLRDDELWSLLEKMRTQKNLLFERCITERARELFK
jgi:uncharacterized protein (TIGR04255 family)